MNGGVTSVIDEIQSGSTSWKACADPVDRLVGAPGVVERSQPYVQVPPSPTIFIINHITRSPYGVFGQTYFITQSKNVMQCAWPFQAPSFERHLEHAVPRHAQPLALKHHKVRPDAAPDMMFSPSCQNRLKLSTRKQSNRGRMQL